MAFLRVSLLFAAVFSLLAACSEASRHAVPDANDGPLVTPRTVSTLAPDLTGDPAEGVAARAPGAKVDQPLSVPESAPPPSARIGDVPEAALLANRIEGWFEDRVGHRGYVQTDKPLYRPGETIWLRVWALRSRDLASGVEGDVQVKLVSPKGAPVIEKRLKGADGTANDFELPPDVPGGEYKIVATAPGVSVERPIIVATYEPPRLRKKLEFVRRAYGPGDRVEATVTIEPSTGAKYANREITALVRLDGVDLPRIKTRTNADGGAVVSFDLPEIDGAGDGILTVMAEDGGVTESVSRRIPIVLRKVRLAFFPEGGALVSGLENRVYFEARTPLEKPADVTGRIVDDLGNPVARFETYHLGLGRLAFQPASGRRYFAEVTKPVGVTERFALPLAQDDGCTLRTYDDFDGVRKELRVAVSCTEPRQVVVAATLREQPFDTAAVFVTPGAPSVVWLSAKDEALARAQGIARVTLFDDAMKPLAERVVFRNRRGGLQVEVSPNRNRYAPRDQVSLAVTTRDASGKPVSAELALSVVDDTVTSFADDKTAHLLSRVLLESDLPGQIEEPNVFLDPKEEKGAFAMELLMGTRGYRKFEWQPVMSVEPDARKREEARQLAAKERAQRERERLERQRRVRKMVREEAAMGARNLPMAAQLQAEMMPPPRPMPIPAPRPVPMPIEPPRLPREPVVRPGLPRPPPVMEDIVDRDWAGKPAPALVPAEYAPVRVFRVPEYKATETFTGLRSDFRETIYWAPSVKTGKDGQATVTFPTSDALTTFRVFTEGVGGGLAGRDETTFESSLPFGLHAKLPQEVSEGDRILLPVTLSNERKEGLDVTLASTFGDSLVPADAPAAGGLLAGGAKSSVFIPLDVKGLAPAEVRFKASSGSLSDELVRTVRVTPPGFPQLWQASGTVKGKVRHEIDLGQALPNASELKLTLYASPLSTMVGGLEGMLRQPSGCFEQTSSTNYPNVMILSYLREHDVKDPALLERATKLLDDGYKRLAGFESRNKGYEWFGGDPGHEALTAYGLVEFADMQKVWGNVDPTMMARTQNWLLSRRDGKGGYLRDPKALDSFGRASPEVTNAYITWALARTQTRGIDAELAVQRRLAKKTKDQYLLGLAAGTLLMTPAHRAEGQTATRRLAAMQDKNGAFTGAEQSITRSGGANLHVETTSLAVLAMLEAGGFETEVRRSIEWLQNNRSGFGQWGATQATVLALEAMTAYARASRKMAGSGTVVLRVNGQVVGEQAYAAGRTDPLVFSGFGASLVPGRNVVEIENAGSTGLPYSMAVEYRALQPATAPDAALSLQTSLSRPSLKMAETVRLEAKVKNVTDKGQPMSVARIGLPGGLASQTWQLKELREKGTIAFFETRPREVTLYFRDFAPGEEKVVPLELVAEVPGRYTAPASHAYLYYTDDRKFWAAPVQVEITP